MAQQVEDRVCVVCVCVVWRIGFGFIGEQGAKSIHAAASAIIRAYINLPDIPFFPEILVKYRSSDHLKNKYLKWWAPQLQVPVAAVSGTNNKKELLYLNMKISEALTS